MGRGKSHQRMLLLGAASRSSRSVACGWLARIIVIVIRGWRVNCGHASSNIDGRIKPSMSASIQQTRQVMKLSLSLVHVQYRWYLPSSTARLGGAAPQAGRRDPHNTLDELRHTFKLPTACPANKVARCRDERPVNAALHLAKALRQIVSTSVPAPTRIRTRPCHGSASCPGMLHGLVGQYEKCLHGVLTAAPSARSAVGAKH